MKRIIVFMFATPEIKLSSLVETKNIAWIACRAGKFVVSLSLNGNGNFSAVD